MSTLTNDDVVQFVGNLTVMQLIELTKELEKKWGVEAKPQITQLQLAPQPEVQAVVQTEFTVVLVSFPSDKKMGVVKLVREIMGLGLLESKTLAEAAPKPVKMDVSKEEAEIVKARFVEAGAVVEIK